MYFLRSGGGISDSRMNAVGCGRKSEAAINHLGFQFKVETIRVTARAASTAARPFALLVADMSSIAPPDFGTGNIATHTATKWHIDYSGGKSDEYTGTGFKYDGSNHL